MTNASVLVDYMAALDTLLVSPSAEMRSSTAAVRQAPFDETQFEEAELALPTSVSVQAYLEEKWQNASTDFERSVAEVQLLGAAAADLAIAERIAYSTIGDSDDALTIWRSGVVGGDEKLIRRAIEEPEKLLAAERLISYRVGESQELLAATYECLRFVRYETIEICGDAVSSMLTMDISLFKQAAKWARVDIGTHVDKIVTGRKRLVVDYVVAAINKIDALLGVESISHIKEMVVEYLMESQENVLVGGIVDRFLDTDTIYEESKGWIQSFDGDEKILKPTAEMIGDLQGSYRGRIRIADVVLKGLSVARLFSPLAKFPWGPLGMASAYLSVFGYILYSAHDHVDSDKYAFFDRVQGVRGTLIAELPVDFDV